MDGIVRAEHVRLGQARCRGQHSLGDVDPYGAAPGILKMFDGAALVRRRELACAPATRERRPHFTVRDRRRREAGRPRDGVAHERRPFLRFDVVLQECAGVQIEDQRRSSITVSEIGLPRSRTRRRGSGGLPPSHLARPSRTIARSCSSSGVSAAGTMTASGRPRSVTVTRSPSAARRRNSLSRFLSSRTPTVVILIVATSWHKCGHTASPPMKLRGRRMPFGGRPKNRQPMAAADGIGNPTPRAGERCRPRP
jgi:hypothetical protein